MIGNYDSVLKELEQKTIVKYKKEKKSKKKFGIKMEHKKWFRSSKENDTYFCIKKYRFEKARNDAYDHIIKHKMRGCLSIEKINL